MKSPLRVALLVVLVTATWGISAFWGPGAPAPEWEAAPVVAAVYANPAERVETHVLRRGETLDRILSRADISGSELAEFLLALREYKNPRSLRAGMEIRIRRWFADDRTRGVDLRLNADSIVRLERGDLGWSGAVEITPTTIDTVFVSGVVEDGRSIYETIVLDEALALPRSEREAIVVELAQEIYGYKLDFAHDIRPGDRYRLVYEREARPDGTARSRRVLIAEIVNQGQEYSAVFFNPRGDGGEYYDRDGRSLQMMFRRYPVDYVRITSSFSWRRYHPVLGRYRAHLGTDFGTGYGAAVKATADGTISFAGRNGSYGNLVKIRHPLGYETRYAHLSRFARGIRSGVKVKQGQIVGYSGATGLATAPHLHYELRRNGSPLNARQVKLPGKPGVPGELLDDFRAVLERRVALLDAFAPRGPQLAEAVGSSERTAVGEK